MITAGILLAAMIDHTLVHLDGGWRWAIAIQMGPAVVLLICMPLMPKSPRWLVQQGRIDEAFAALKMVRDEIDAEVELEEIMTCHEKEKVPGLVAKYVAKAFILFQSLVMGSTISELYSRSTVDSAVDK